MEEKNREMTFRIPWGDFVRVSPATNCSLNLIAQREDGKSLTQLVNAEEQSNNPNALKWKIGQGDD